MATEICLRIEDDGSMSVSQEDAAQETAENEQQESGTPVRSIKDALKLISEMAQAATMSEEVPQEEAGMEEGFSGGNGY